MNIKVAVVTVLLGLGATEAVAQPGWYRPFAEVPPYEVVRLVRARGLTPVSRPVLVGPNYVVQVTDRNGDLKLGCGRRRVRRHPERGLAQPPAAAVGAARMGAAAAVARPR